MPRAMWSGVIGFGMVSIPVKLYAATEHKSISFHQVHAKCKTRIKEVRWCPHCDKQVVWDEIEKGYEYAKGKHVAVSEEDLESLPLPSKSVIDVSAFVEASEIDPIYFEKTYYLEAEKTAARPFALLMQTLVDKEMVGIGSVALRSKERLCALRPVGGNLILSTLLYPDEIRIDLDSKMPTAKITKQEMTMAHSLVDLLSQKFEPESYIDHYREAMKKLIDKKLEGEPLEEAATETKGRGGVVDLMDALRESLKNIKADDAGKPGRKKSAAQTHKPKAETKKLPAATKRSTRRSSTSAQAKKKRRGAA